MKIVYLDTETTDLTPGQSCQLSYVIEDGKEIQGKNFYFEVDHVEAESIHGLSVEKLKELSGGLKFIDIKIEFLSDIEGAMIIGHNIKFDLGFINSELKNLSVKNKLILKDKSTMENAKKYLEKRLSKEELNKFYRYTTEFKYLENKVLYHAIKKYFLDAENIMETSKNRITF